MRFSRLFLLLIFFLGACSTCGFARAEIVTWQDPDTGLSLHYPDRWARVANYQSDDVFTVVAPGLNDFAGCRVRVRDEDRFGMYPRAQAVNVQRRFFGPEFWQEYLHEHDHALVTGYSDGGLGRGFGSVIETTFRSATGTKIWKKGLMAAAPYAGKLYVMECSAAANAYRKWVPGFTNFMRSIDFRKMGNDHRNGEYRDFIGDGALKIHGRRPQDLYVQ